MRRRRLLATGAALLTLCVWSPLASASDGGPDGQIEAGAVTPGSNGGGGGSGGAGPVPGSGGGGQPGSGFPGRGGGSATVDNDWDCRFYKHIDNVNGAAIGGAEVTDLSPDNTYVRYCYYRGELRITELFTYNPSMPGGQPPPAPADPEQLARAALDAAKLPDPELVSAPPQGGTTPVNLPVWFWADLPGPDQATAQADANNSAVTTATPTGTLTIDPGDGSEPIICPNGGVPWARGRPDSTPGACLHTYLKPGTYEVTTTLTWSVRYEANIIGLPITGALPDETTRSTRSITITELTTRLIPN